MDTEESTTAVNESVDETTTPTESAPVETNESHADDTTEEVSEVETESQTEEPDAEVAEEEQAEETDTEDKPQSKGEKRVDQLNTEIRDLVAKRNAIRQEVEQLHSQAYKPAQVDELLEQVNPDTGDYYNRLEAQLEAMRQEREIEKYNNQVSESLVTLETEVQRVIDEFPMFDTQSADYNEELATEVADILNDNLIRDPNTGQVIGSRTSPYKLYKSYAKAAQASAVKAEAKAQRNVETMLKNADPTPARKGTPVPFEKMSLSQQEAYLRKRGHDV